MMIMPTPDKNDVRVKPSPIHGKLLNTDCVFLYSWKARLTHRALKCTKAYSVLEDVQLTLQDKPSGLKPDWHYTISRSSTPGMMHAQSSSSSTSASTIYTQTDSSSTAASPVFSQSPLLNSDHALSLLAMSPPSQFSKPSHPVFLLDEKPARRQEDTCSITVGRVPTVLLLCGSSHVFSPFACLVPTVITMARGNSRG